ncbi:MAG: hypothetical protein A2166_04035 [Omnitrophica WOR_2 bacterium RBG_13_41_10]|nr:MAG: hypothetical protein A2166_04035 [Omnitrophica WOR_2 bacterium RBG_13_41_10]
MVKIKVLTTGLGSFPYKEPQKALELILKYTPSVPFWPQLPKRDVRERMVAQFSEHFPCIKVGRDGIFFSGEGKERELELFYERIIANDLDYFAISADYALGLQKFYQKLEDTNLKDAEFIKCQITGPFTFAASINDEKGVALLHDSVFRQAIIKGLTMKALWQIKLFRKFNKKIIIFVDEPYLGCFGSAYTPINKEEVLRGLRELTQGIKSADTLIGVHCCGNTDWSLFTDVTSIDVISFDASSFLEKFLIYAEDIKKFIERRGIVCWGIVPTQEFSGKETPVLLSHKLREGIAALTKKGIAPEALLGKIFISPACGLGALDEAKAEKILRLLADTAVNLEKNT